MISTARKAKIKWNCRRGMLELDLMLSKFFEASFDSLSEEQIRQFEALLETQDPELYALLTGQIVTDKKELTDIVALVRSHHTN